MRLSQNCSKYNALILWPCAMLLWGYVLQSKYCWSTALAYGGFFRTTSKTSYAILPLEVTHGSWQEVERELSNQSWSYEWSHALLGPQDKPINLATVAPPCTKSAIPWWNGLRYLLLGRSHSSRRRPKGRPGNTHRKRIHLAWRQGTEGLSTAPQQKTSATITKEEVKEGAGWRRRSKNPRYADIGDHREWCRKIGQQGRGGGNFDRSKRTNQERPLNARPAATTRSIKPLASLGIKRMQS